MLILGELKNPSLSFKFGTLDNLTSKDTKDTVLQSLSNGDICFAQYGPSVPVETTSNAEGNETQEQKFTPEAGALYVKMDNKLLPVSLPPGPIGIPLVGVGDTSSPIYTSTLSHIGIGGDPINDPDTKTDENTEGSPYSITAYENSLFKKDIVFESKIRGSNNLFSLIADESQGAAEVTIPQGMIFDTTPESSSTISTVSIYDGSIDVWYWDESNGEGQEMWWFSNINTFIYGKIDNYKTNSATTYIVDDSNFSYTTTFYNAKSEYQYSSSLNIGKNVLLNTDMGSAIIAGGNAKIEINNTVRNPDKLSVPNSILIKTGISEDCFIKLQSSKITTTSSFITLTEPMCQIIKESSIESSWWNGREGAMIHLENDKIGYYPFLSMITQNGNWQIGTYPLEYNYQDKLIFTYVTDDAYENCTEDEDAFKHIKFSEEGMIESEALQSNNYGTESPDDGNKIINLIDGTLYFRILE